MLRGLFLVHSLQDFFVKKKAMVQITSSTVATVNTTLVNWYVFVNFYKLMSLIYFFSLWIAIKTRNNIFM